MKIYDCFMYFDEDLVLDLRLNYLSKYVDKFVIVESQYNHNGEKRKLQFDKKKFKEFSNKIIYIETDKIPEGIEEINNKESEDIKSTKYILNAAKRENFQRNQIVQGLTNADENDWVMDENQQNRLTELTFRDKNLNAEIPYNIGDLDSLKKLEINNSGIIGQIPESIGNLTELRDLILTYNELEGEIPNQVYCLSSFELF